MRRVALSICMAGAIASLLTLAAHSDPAGIGRVTKGVEPPWLTVRAKAEEGTATFVLNISPSEIKGMGDNQRVYFCLRFSVRQENKTVFSIPVSLEKVKTGLVTSFSVPFEVAEKAVLRLDVQSRLAKNGQHYRIKLGSYLEEAKPAAEPGAEDRAG